MRTQDRHHISRGAAYALATALVASTAAAGAKYLAGDLSPWFIVWIQYGVCTLMVTPWLLRQGPSALRTARPGLHLVRSLSGWLGFTTFYLALPLVPLVDATLLRSAAPLWVPLVVFAWLGGGIPAMRWVALLGGFAGVLLILQPRGLEVNAGHLLGLTAGLSLAISMATTRALSTTEPASRVLFYYFFVSFLASTPMALFHLTLPTPVQVPILLYVGVSIFVTMVLYTRAYSHAPTSIIAPLSYAAVPLSGLMDWLFWQQLPGGLAIAGAVLVIASGVVAVRSHTGKPDEH